jgi:hypothetical protein
MAVGSINETAAPPGFAWRCYLDVEIAGTAPDVAMAEAHLKKAIAKRRHLEARAA